MNSPITSDMLKNADIPEEKHAQIIAMHHQYFDAELRETEEERKLPKLYKVAATYGMASTKQRRLTALEKAQMEAYRASLITFSNCHRSRV